jgi:7-carboxy-7-deazaguanine synthase
MRIAEIFHSIQGEGPAMGRQATFIRLAGCNLSCQGCDTHLKSWVEQTPQWVLGEIQKERETKRVVITGGEPTEQMSELSELIALLRKDGIEIHIETNGTRIIPDEILMKLSLVVVSPKRGSDNNLNYWTAKENVHLKFVIGDASWCWPPVQLERIMQSLPKERIWIMAFGTDPEMIIAKDAWDLALRLGVNYSDRLHIRLRRR